MGDLHIFLLVYWEYYLLKGSSSQKGPLIIINLTCSRRRDWLTWVLLSIFFLYFYGVLIYHLAQDTGLIPLLLWDKLTTYMGSKHVSRFLASSLKHFPSACREHSTGSRWELPYAELQLYAICCASVGNGYGRQSLVFWPSNNTSKSKKNYLNFKSGLFLWVIPILWDISQCFISHYFIKEVIQLANWIFFFKIVLLFCPSHRHSTHFSRIFHTETLLFKL